MEGKLNSILFGLLGKNISYSFSKNYFSKKFIDLKLEGYKYVNFDIEKIQDFPEILSEFKTILKGCNVTIPYKESVFNYLDEVDTIASEIGAVNTIKFTNDGRLVGYNTDVVGFENSLIPLLKKHHTKALILGTGGASKAVAYVFKKLNIDYYKISRNPKGSTELPYADLSDKLLNECTIVVNCSPVGTYPNINEKPMIPYQFLTPKHLLYDLIYNPVETAFLLEGKKRGALVKNGCEMLELQAEESWRLWNK